MVLAKKKRRSRNSISAGSIILILGLIALIGGVITGVTFLFFKQEKRLPLAENLCPQKGSIYNIAILLDATDGIADITKLSIKRRIENEIKSLERYARLQMYTVDGAGLSSPIDTVCNPGSPDDLTTLGQSGIVANPVLVQNRYNDFVSKSLEAVDKILNRNFEAEQSPLLGAIQKISLLLPEPVTYPVKYKTTTGKNKVIFITDFLENTKTFSMYGLNKKLEQSFDESRAEEKFGANFDKVDIEIWLIQRNHPNAPTSGEVKKFWLRVFSQIFNKTRVGEFIIDPLPGEL